MASWLCVPCYVNTADDRSHIFFVDLSRLSPGKKAENCEYSDAEVPKLRVGKNFKFTCFWLKGFRLFMIPSKTSNSVGTVTLSEEFLRSRYHMSLEESMIEYMAPMHFRKQCPILVPTPDGKLIVMSSIIPSQGLRNDDDEPDFELYDPEKNVWEVLPPIQPFQRNCRNCRVNWGVFKDQTTLVVKVSLPTGRDMQFEFDIIKRIWRPSERRLGGGLAVGSRMRIAAVLKNELCLTPYKVLDIEHGSQSDFIPSSFKDCKHYEFDFRSALVFGECHFYVVQASMVRNSSTAKFSVLKYFLNIENYYLGRTELERRRRGELGIVMRNEITQLVRLGMPLEKLKLAICLVCEGRLKLKRGWQPPIDVQLLGSARFVVHNCNCSILPLETPSLFQLPASQKPKPVCVSSQDMDMI